MMEMTAFNATNAHKKLLKLCANPVDLRRPEALHKERLSGFTSSSTHFTLHYWAQRVNEDVIDALQELADECDLVNQFKAMKAGVVMNTVHGVESEERQVLHTACRDIFSAEPCCVMATDKALQELEKLKVFLDDLDSGKLSNEKGEKFDTLIHIGIGGSDLGPRSVFEALRAFGKKNRKVFFIANVDPDDAADVLDQVDLAKSLVSVVSKSGTTLETLTNEEFVRGKILQAGLDPEKRFIAVTGEGSPLDDPEKYLRSFYMFDYIGGRYSTTSMVGLVMLGFSLGYEQITEFLRGAAVLDAEAEEKDIRKNPALLLAMLGIWNHSYLNMATLAVLAYSQPLHRFAAHLQQCDMESNGKSVNRKGSRVEYQTGPIVWGEPGTNGQHAFYQLLHQGTEVVPCEFIGFKKSQRGVDSMVQGTSSQQKLIANILAQSVALACGQENDNPNRYFPGNRPNSVLVADRLTPEVMGALLALYEAKIVFQGFAWDINSFDQEGVQLGKVLATQFLREMSSSEKQKESIEKMLLKIFAMV
jgi:glucose-6-phosphate isomerase